MTVDRQLKYCGVKHLAELEALKRIADNVIKAARLAKEGNVHGTSAHVILIEGERGVGKTRIAMEIYRHLALVHDPEKYWPRNVGGAALQDDVMPRATDCTFDVSPAFVWWGMAIGEGKNPGNTVFKSLGDLLPHLAAAHIAARQRRTGSGMVAELAELGLELGLPVLEGAVELTGLSTIKAIGMTILKIGLILKGHLGEPTDSLTKEKERVDGVIDSVMDDLSKLFSPGSGTFAGIPLIILIDDAQFDSDPWMAVFLEKLIARSQRENWPLLLMLTHWSRQLGEWTDAAGQLHNRSRIASVLDHARLAPSHRLGPFAGEGGGSLPQEAFTTIRLGAIEDDLSPAISARFPGLDQNDVRLISRKSGGNPRKVEQILEEIDENPIWFVGNEIDKGLTEQGREEVMELAKLEIDKVVRKRFGDTPPEVRRAMAIASLVGHRFVVDLVDRLAQERFKFEARPHLADAEDRYRFLRDVVNNPRNDIASFAERLFIDAAREYRASGRIRQMDKTWPPDSELYESLDVLLTELVRNIDAFPRLTVDDLSLCFSLAADRMSARDDPLAGLALAHLVRLEGQRGNLEGAYSAASRFIEGFESSLSNTQ